VEIINGVKRATLESARIGGSANHLDVDSEATDIGNELGVSDTHFDFKRDKLGGDW